jgi:DNA polymerase-1
VKTILFDLEADGLLRDEGPKKKAATRIHCIVAAEWETKQRHGFRPHEVKEGLALLASADVLVAHNAWGYDIPLIHKLHPEWSWQGVVRDTYAIMPMLFSDIKRTHDFRLNHQGKLPGKFIGKHSLEAWGFRLGKYKGDFGKQENAWEQFTEEMFTYCHGDVDVLEELWRIVLKHEPKGDAIENECGASRIVKRQERYGVRFDEAAAAELQTTLVQKRLDAERRLKEAIPPWTVKLPDFIPKRNNKTKGYVAGVPVPREKVIEFNPASSAHKADRLQVLYGWKPKEYTDGGSVELTEKILKTLDYPIVPLLLEWEILNDRLEKLVEGKGSWVKCVRNGRIHGAVNTNGTVTGRMSHFKPALAGTPKVGKPWGKECRSLFIADEGGVLVGCDAQGLELRMLAHFLARWDGGAFAQQVISGDPHTYMQQATGIKNRDTQKTWTYAWLYGSGDPNLAALIGCSEAQAKRIRLNLMRGIPAFGSLKKKIEETIKRNKCLIGLDGRKLPCRSAHSALNTLLQSAGAVVMKRALIILDGWLREAGLVPGVDYEFVLNIHDEWQIACRPEHADHIADSAKEAIRAAGEHYKLRCPLAGDAKIGKNWAETH